MLAKGTIVTLLGQGVPLVVAVLALPVVAGGLSVERFGLLVLSWAVVGYVGAFDLGVGRAGVHYISGALSRNALDDVPRIVGTTLAVQGVLGLVAAIVMTLATPLLAVHVFHLPLDLQSEGRAALALTGFAVPAVLLTSSLRGALYAAQRFGEVNAVVAASNSSIYVLSAFGVWAGWSVPGIVSLLVASKMIALVVLWQVTTRRCPGLAGSRLSADRHTLRDLLRFGSWVTLSTALLPVLNRAERLFVPALLSIEALAFYTVPFEATSRLAVIPVSMAATLFPAFSRLTGSDSRSVEGLLVRPIRYLMLAMTPIAIVGVLFAHGLLSLWMGPSFAIEASPTLRVLAAAFFFASFSHLLRATLQGLGRPDLKGKLDLVNATLFVILLMTLIPRFGLIGAAAARLVSALVDLVASLLLVGVAARERLSAPQLWRRLGPDVAAAAGFVVVAAAGVAWFGEGAVALLLFAAALGAYLSAFWIVLTDKTDRKTFTGALHWLARSGGGPLAAAVEPGERR